MCTKNELNSILQKLTQIYRSVYGENLVQVILYGSYARGDYHTDSDVDVVAIVHGDRKTLQQQLKKQKEEMTANGIVSFFSKAGFQRKRPDGS